MQNSESNQETSVASAPVMPPQRDPVQVQAYHRAKRYVHLSHIALGIIYWGCWAVFMATWAAWLGQQFPSSPWFSLLATGMVMLGGSVLISLPLDYYSGYILERRFNLTNQTPGSWFIFQLKSWLVGGVIGGILLAGLYAALWHGGTWWGVWVWLGVLAFSVLLAKVFPLIILPLFYPATPMDRPALAERLTRLAGDAGMTITGIFNLQLSKETKKANAMLAGLGSTRRVYLSDTLLEAFNDDQIAVVFAHELGHHIRSHIYKGIGISAVASSILVTAIYGALRASAGTMEHWPVAVASLAYVMLILSTIPLLIAPVTNAISRHFERQCDSDALRLTQNPRAYREAFELLSQLNLADENPPRWEVILFEDHPPLRERIAMADAVKSDPVA